MRINAIDDRRLLGVSLIALGLALAAAAGVWGVLAFQHMTWAADLCGPTTGHCLRCVAAASAGVAAAAAFAGGLALLGPPDRQTVRHIA